MRKTHKKILGFVGLGFVAAVTTVAASIPAPIASATGSAVDTLRVYVTHNDPELTMTTESPATITEPGYSFRVGYDNVSDVTVTIENKNDAGETLYSGTIWSENTGNALGSKDFNLNLNDYGGYGNITIKAVAIGDGGVPIERILTVKYTAADENTSGEGEDEPSVPIDIPEETVVTVDFTLYAADKETVVKDDIPSVQNPGDNVTIDLSDVTPDGIYWLKKVSKNQHGDILKTDWEMILIDKDPGGEVYPIVVPDLGEELSKATISVTNSDGTEVVGKTVMNPQPGQTINIDIPHDLPAGIYKITTKYYNMNDEVIKTIIEYFIKSTTGGEVVVPVEPKVDSVTTIETEIYNDKNEVVRILKADRKTGMMEVYDANGNLLFNVPGGYNDDYRKMTIPMTGLPSGDYIGIISYKNQYGHLVGNTKRIRIHWQEGQAIIVPDTGGLFQGLNISREDYLITGAVVFMIIGVVAVGVIRRKHRK